mmetsp:Transcript_9458/g.38309  ORF Transcript_9458/g.38309 Transcript_9458/m.38309 type:complete len:331 (+) Transcript_9458:1142-2134(+)
MPQVIQIRQVDDVQADDFQIIRVVVVVPRRLDAGHERDASNAREPIVRSRVRRERDAVLGDHRLAQRGKRRRRPRPTLLLLGNHQPRRLGRPSPPPDRTPRPEPQQMDTLAIARAPGVGDVRRGEDRPPAVAAEIDESTGEIFSAHVRPIRARDVSRLRVQLRQVLGVDVHRLGLLGLRGGGEERDGDGVVFVGSESKRRGPDASALSRFFAKHRGEPVDAIGGAGDELVAAGVRHELAPRRGGGGGVRGVSVGVDASSFAVVVARGEIIVKDGWVKVAVHIVDAGRVPAPITAIRRERVQRDVDPVHVAELTPRADELASVLHALWPRI